MLANFERIPLKILYKNFRSTAKVKDKQNHVPVTLLEHSLCPREFDMEGIYRRSAMVGSKKRDECSEEARTRILDAARVSVSPRGSSRVS